VSAAPRWRRLSIEAAAIILSILTAFAIDAWWEGQLEVREEQELLLGLSAEFEENAALLDTVVARSSRGRLHLQRLVGGSIQELSAIPPNETWVSVYEPLIRTWSRSPATGFLDATVNFGKLAPYVSVSSLPLSRRPAPTLRLSPKPGSYSQARP
jgi:hypothetical protein